MNKEIRKIRDNLEKTRNAWRTEEVETDAKIKNARARLEEANKRLNTAKDAIIYKNAEREIADIQSEIAFYNQQREQFQHTYSEEEYKEVKQTINAEKSRIIELHGAEIRKAFEELTAKLEIFDAEAVELTKLNNMLCEMSKKKPGQVRGDLIRELSTTEGDKRPFDEFASFLDYYTRRKATKKGREACVSK